MYIFRKLFLNDKNIFRTEGKSGLAPAVFLEKTTFGELNSRTNPGFSKVIFLKLNRFLFVNLQKKAIAKTAFKKLEIHLVIVAICR